MDFWTQGKSNVNKISAYRGRGLDGDSIELINKMNHIIICISKY